MSVVYRTNFNLESRILIMGIIVLLAIVLTELNESNDTTSALSSKLRTCISYNYNEFFITYTTT